MDREVEEILGVVAQWNNIKQDATLDARRMPYHDTLRWELSILLADATIKVYIIMKMNDPQTLLRCERLSLHGASRLLLTALRAMRKWRASRYVLQDAIRRAKRARTILDRL